MPSKPCTRQDCINSAKKQKGVPQFPPQAFCFNKYHYNTHRKRETERKETVVPWDVAKRNEKVGFTHLWQQVVGSLAYWQAVPTPHLIPRHQCARTRNFNTKHTSWFITALFDIFHLFSIYDSIDHVISISHDKPSQSPSTRQIQPPITTAPSNSSGENVILRTLTIWYISTAIYPPLHF